MRTNILNVLRMVLVGAVGLVGACTAEEKIIEPTDFAFDGTCVNCHAGLSAGHVHKNYKLRCIDCHGGNDQVQVPQNVLANKSTQRGAGGFRDPALLEQAHVRPDPKLARFFYANGIDDDGDGTVDEPPVFDQFPNPTQLLDPGEIFEPGLHGEGGGEFMDMELNRDLNYTRFLNPGDLRVATISCGGGSRAAFDGGGNGGCHQQTIDIVRRSIMVNQAAVTNGAYYGNESWRAEFKTARDNDVEGGGGLNPAEDPRFGAAGYGLDYAAAGSVDACIQAPADPKNPRSQPVFDRACLQARALEIDNSVPENLGGNAVRAGALGNTGVAGENLPTMEIAQGIIPPAPGVVPGQTLAQLGAGDTRIPWGGQPTASDAHAELEPLFNGFVLPPGVLPAVLAPDGVPDPVDNILRTFRAYYPLNYPGSTTNFNFTFGTSILPEIARFKTASPYGRGHSSGCAACHTPYNYEGNRQAQKILNDDPTVDRNGDGQPDGPVSFVDDPTTKHREFDPKNDIKEVEGVDRLVGRPVKHDEVALVGPVARVPSDTDGNGQPDPEQLKTYSANHTTTTRIDTDTCGLCHGFVTRINYAYQGMAEEEQRDSLARRKPIEFQTPTGTSVRILDSWVREDNDVDNNGVKDAVPTIIIPDGVAIVNLAKQRDAELAKEGLIPGFGGCIYNTFSEDCNNNGELDTALVLEKRDGFGNVLATKTINEDLNGNGKLDLIDRQPREKAIDGRQVRYVYGGRNGSTRQMDVHLERGMHCIDCHFIQDVHGDGNVYSTNWDAIEIECEDCHGASGKTTFKTSGPNGGNDMRKALNEDLEPFFEEVDGSVIQRSRVTPGLSWRVPQMNEVNGNALAREAHNSAHIAEPGEGSTFSGEQGSSELTQAKVECATCHNGFVTNCLNCHVEINVGDKQRDKLNPDGSIEKSAGENEIWLSNKHNPGHINFLLLGLLRGAVYMGVASKTEKGRLATFRSSMEVYVGVSDATGDQLRENMGFTTFQTFDGNSGRANVATSGVAKNQTMAHTVRPNEARGCEVCHSLVNDQGQTRNEHLLAQTYGLGTGSLPITGDWILATGTNGLELFEYKQERELANNLIAGASTRFPGLIANFANRTAANVEPVLTGAVANDVVLIRNFNPTPPVGQTVPPTLRDLAITAVDQAGQGRLVISDVSARGHRVAATRPTPGAPQANACNTDPCVLNFGANIPVSLAHIGPDVSDPYIYVAAGNGIAVVRIDNAQALGGPINAQILAGGTRALTGGRTATKVALAGDLLYVGTLDGAIEVFDLSNPESPQSRGVVTLPANTRVNDIAISGFIMYVATANGTAALSLTDPLVPTAVEGGTIQFVGPGANGLYVSEGHVYVAAGAQGVHELDARTVATMTDLGNIAPVGVNAVDVILSLLPGQRWIIALEATGDITYIKLDGTRTRQERCYPNPGSADCELEIEMFDPTRSGRDPSFDPVTNTFDAIDPSSPTVATQQSAILANGRRLARPQIIDQIGTLTGRRYRDSFMPGSGSISNQVMGRMRAVQVCELDGQASTNPSGLDALGYFVDGACVPFEANQKPRRACKPGLLGAGLRRIMCDEQEKAEPKTADPARPGIPTRGRLGAIGTSVTARATIKS